jgi:hypothetical protein
MNLRIYKVKNSLPRAFVCQNWSWAPSHKAAVESLRGLHKSDFDPENRALIEPLPSEEAASDPTKDPSNSLLPNAVHTQAGVIYPAAKIPESAPKTQAPVFLKDCPEHISISVNLPKPNFMILADQFYPGWTASVDGLNTPIFRANACFRAVYVSKGGHLIQFDYEPLSLTIGLYCALAGLSLAGWLLLIVLAPSGLRLLRRMAGEDV